MRTYNLIALMLGLVGAAALVADLGPHEIGQAFGASGFGLIAVIAFRLVPLGLDSFAWRYLFEPARRPRYARLFWVRIAGEAVNTLLPVLQIGGEVVKARLLAMRGTAGAAAGASVVVDLTVGLFTLLIFALIGAALLFWRYQANALAETIVIGAGIGLATLAGLLVLQHARPFTWLSRIVSRMARGEEWGRLTGGGAALDQAVTALYRNPRGLMANGMWQLIGWLSGTGEVWLALHFMGVSDRLLDALLIESLIQAIRAVGFAVPGALGVQEGGLVLIGTAIGIDGSAMLALSLIKRVRELGFGLPGLLLWQYAEGRHLFGQRKKRAGGKAAQGKAETPNT